MTETQSATSQKRFSDEMFRVPTASDEAPGFNPSFRKPKDPPTILASFFSGIRQMAAGLWTLRGALFRTLRFVVGGFLCTLGWFGRMIGTVGLQVVHPDDRRCFQNGDSR